MVENRFETTMVTDGSASPRIDIYGLLAALLTRPPSGDRLEHLTNIDLHPDIPPALSRAVKDVKAAADRTDPAAAAREYQRLFEGLGRGQVVPEASWYFQNRLAGAPPLPLQEHLAALHIERRGEACGAEDHAAALCELMVLIIAETRIPIPDKAAFFNTHLAPWMPLFFEDLQNAPAANFYRAVGQLGALFMQLEKDLLRERVNG
jgi:TorA maturation chaperone TorD